jgi:hypothetical protein
MEYGVITNNVASSDVFGASSGSGGAIYIHGPATIAYSTISSNAADVGGAIVSTDSVQLENTTISGNTASLYGAASVRSAALYGSTVVLNSSKLPNVSGGIAASYLTAESSMIALNRNGTGGMSQPSDLVVGSGYVFGANNLIVSTNVAVPLDTVRGCPHIAPLMDNGGATQTHALLQPSPAIDAGNTVVPFTWDQRGISYARVVNGLPDIGAYEWSEDTGDEIHFSGFETCE